jgi:hypothetical protein
MQPLRPPGSPALRARERILKQPQSVEMEWRLIRLLASMAKRVLEAEEPWSGAPIEDGGGPVAEGVNHPALPCIAPIGVAGTADAFHAPQNTAAASKPPQDAAPRSLRRAHREGAS